MFAADAESAERSQSVVFCKYLRINVFLMYVGHFLGQEKLWAVAPGTVPLVPHRQEHGVMDP